MSRFEIDDQFLSHHKTVRALRSGAQSLQMWLAIRTYAGVNNSDGMVPDEDIDDLPGAPKEPRKWLAVLVGCGKPLPGGDRGPGLVDRIEGGWQLHDYRDHGLSPEEIEQRKQLARDRQKRWRQGRIGPTNQQSNSVTNASTYASRDALGDVPDPIRSEEIRSKDLGVGSKDLNRSAQDAPLPPPPPPVVRRSQPETRIAAVPPTALQPPAPKTEHSEPPAAIPTSAGNVAQLPTRRIRATDDLRTCPIGELAQRCKENTADAGMAGIGERPELQRINQAWSEGVGLRPRPLGTYSIGNRTMLTLLEAFEAYPEQDLLRACQQASRDDWCTGKTAGKGDTPKKRDIGCFTLTVIRRLLDAAEEHVPKRVHPAVAKMLEEENRRRSAQ